jgi:hypothetical protein
MLDRSSVIVEPELPDGGELVAAGRTLARRSWTVGDSPFLKAHGVS